MSAKAAGETKSNEAENPPMSPAAKAVMTVALMSAVLLVALDVNIIGLVQSKRHKRVVQLLTWVGSHRDANHHRRVWEAGPCRLVRCSFRTEQDGTSAHVREARAIIPDQASILYCQWSIDGRLSYLRTCASVRDSHLWTGDSRLWCGWNHVDNIEHGGLHSVKAGISFLRVSDI
jgi:hypothetical protein